MKTNCVSETKLKWNRRNENIRSSFGFCLRAYVTFVITKILRSNMWFHLSLSLSLSLSALLSIRPDALSQQVFSWMLSYFQCDLCSFPNWKRYYLIRFSSFCLNRFFSIVVLFKSMLKQQMQILSCCLISFLTVYLTLGEFLLNRTFIFYPENVFLNI